MKRFTCSAGNFSIAEAINNQTPLGFYDSLYQITANPDLRNGTVLCYDATGPEGLFSQIQNVVNSDKRWVTTSPHYWTEKCEDTTIITTINRVLAPGTPGGNVTAPVDRSSHTRSGDFSTPMAGRRAYIRELDGQAVNILSVNRTTKLQHTVTLQPVNGETIDLSGRDSYTLLVNPLRMYKKGDTECIATEGLTSEQPILRKGFLQKYEKGYQIHDDEITGYAFGVEFRIARGINPLTGKAIEFYNLPLLQDAALVDYMDTRNIELLHGQRDDVKGEGFDGLFTNTRSQGMFSRYYDPNDGTSLKTNLFNMMKSLRKVNGAKEWLFIYDFGFNMDWSEQIAALVKSIATPLTYKLFGDGGEGVRDFTWYEFTDFKAYGYKFRGYMLDALDTQRYGNFNENFAYLIPATTYYDTNGNRVAPVTFVNIKADEESPEKKMWVDDTRKRGCRYVNLFVQDTFGIEQHCASKTGIWQRIDCQS
jgi:hypothetical protein